MIFEYLVIYFISRNVLKWKTFAFAAYDVEDVDTCIYDGYLAQEEDVYVTLTGCAHTDTFNVNKIYE